MPLVGAADYLWLSETFGFNWWEVLFRSHGGSPAIVWLIKSNCRSTRQAGQGPGAQCLYHGDGHAAREKNAGQERAGSPAPSWGFVLTSALQTVRPGLGLPPTLLPTAHACSGVAGR